MKPGPDPLLSCPSHHGAAALGGGTTTTLIT